MCIESLGALMAAGLAIPAAAYLLVKPRIRKSPDFVQAADLSRFQLRAPEEVVFHRTRIDGWRMANEKATAWVVKLDENNLVAYSPACTHLGCAYHWDDQQKDFVCPCHNSVFGIDGKVLAGPAPRPLDRYQIRVDNGKLFIGSQIEQV